MPKQDMSCSTAIYCTIFFFTLQNGFWLKKKKKKFLFCFFSHCFYCSEKLKQCLGWGGSFMRLWAFFFMWQDTDRLLWVCVDASKWFREHEAKDVTGQKSQHSGRAIPTAHHLANTPSAKSMVVTGSSTYPQACFGDVFLGFFCCCFFAGIAWV